MLLVLLRLAPPDVAARAAYDELVLHLLGSALRDLSSHKVYERAKLPLNLEKQRYRKQFEFQCAN